MARHVRAGAVGRVVSGGARQAPRARYLPIARRSVDWGSREERPGPAALTTLAILELEEVGEPHEQPGADLEAACRVHHATRGPPVTQPIARHHVGDREQVRSRIPLHVFSMREWAIRPSAAGRSMGRQSSLWRCQ
jgi:hypothetical protein